ncbi:hypothetical protein TVAG_118080 [Trichomonas vaginalis G3]|uniref:Uncharacterized protein n=1 Tax=Trichomonas vaginalis (strain ATCC PRA-98 / G3) TaxID=412133 RepID=A2EHZ5_TRIV3|nr:hypothetical protein TVAGG3_0230190 [Trichomonas vaginalis G3]EAY07727.1 hypothetical protein TVAG_118080 [Trichomonas vaginalis G3]KAI5552570.1 hypothetical protein TVAGG3_0230190 [Trichomonas vaginalis G3]|eukprot:XP_001319950.1 hypothetical protein [Trichomonas vaginalis G3]
MSKFERSITQTINKGGTQIKKRFNVHVAVDQQLSELQSQVDKIISYEEHIKSRIKFNELKNDAKEKELRKDMGGFQNTYSVTLKNIHDEAESLIISRNKLIQQLQNTKEKMILYDEKIHEYQAYIEKLESREVKLGQKQTIFTNKYSDLPNHIALNNLMHQREERITKYTGDIDKIELEIADLHSAMQYSDNKIKKIQDQSQKIKEKVEELSNYKNQLEKQNESIIDEIKAKLKEDLDKSYKFNEQYILLHNEHVQITKKISELSTQYMKLDVKQQNTENAVVITGSNPETLTLDPTTFPNVEKIMDQLKTKIDDFDQTMEARTKTATEKLKILTEEKEKVAKEIKYYTDYNENLNKIINEKEKKAEEYTQKINDLESHKEETQEEKPKESKNDCVLCNMYFNKDRGVRISAQIASMRQVKAEENLKCEINKLTQQSEVLKTEIARITRENGLLFAKVRSYQIKLEKIFSKQSERIDNFHDIVRKEVNPDLLQLVTELTNERKERRAKNAERFDRMEKKKDLFGKLNQLLALRRREKDRVPESKIAQEFNEIDELTTKIQLELINWRTLRPNGEDQMLLDRWNAFLPEINCLL